MEKNTQLPAEVVEEINKKANELYHSGVINKSTMGIDDLPKDYEGVYYLDESPAAGNMPETKWVKDALQWAKEAIDFTYDYVKVPDSLVETWGNMYMNTMHAIQEAQREIESPAAGREEDAVSFAQWLATERWQPRINTEWARYETVYSDVSVKTTGELYKLFKQQNENP